MHEYDIVEVTSDYPDLAPVLVVGTRGVIVDLPTDSSVAAVEFALTGEIDGFLLDLDELRLVEAGNRQGYDTPQD